MTLEVPNLFIILAFAFFFGPMLICGMCACLKSFWRVKRKKKERQGETYVTGYEEEDDNPVFDTVDELFAYMEEEEDEE